jgi:hypothetical protein
VDIRKRLLHDSGAASYYLKPLLRHPPRRVERAAHGQLESFRTKDGRTYVYSVQDAGISLFIYACDLIREPYQPDEPEPEEPPILEAIRNARDPDEVFRRFEGPDPSKQFVDVRLMVYGPDDPRSGYESPVPDLSD